MARRGKLKIDPIIRRLNRNYVTTLETLISTHTTMEIQAASAAVAVMATVFHVKDYTPVHVASYVMPFPAVMAAMAFIVSV